MKLPWSKSTQGRIAAFIGAIAFLAAIIGVVVIINSARYQQQLAEMRFYSDRISTHNKAYASLLKEQIALKNILAYTRRYPEDWGVAKDYGESYRHLEILFQYAEMQQMQVVDLETEQLLENIDAYTQQVDAFYEVINSWDPQTESGVDQQQEMLDQAAAALETSLQQAVTRDQKSVEDTNTAMTGTTQASMQAGQVALLLLAVLIVWAMYTTFDIARPLDVLTSAIVAFENKTFQPEMLESTNRRQDELGQLGRAVGGMAQSISESNRIKEAFLQAAQRFIPVQYLDFLEKDSITSVNLGDHVNAEMSVMFSDIRGFTTMSESMTAKENFDFVNEYLKLVSPIIQEHEGFIVKFLGDGMMAIFPYDVADAVQAGIEKARTVQEFNQILHARGLPEIAVGIGIHTGAMMVGMIGEEMRMQGDAFSDNVNLTARIEGLNKFYGTSMIISADTLRQLPQPVNFRMRFLGRAVVKGRSAPLGMYEVYEGLPENIAALKDESRADFERGIGLFIEGCFREAADLFVRVLAANPNDKTARLYLESCLALAERPLPENWNGAIVMDEK